MADTRLPPSLRRRDDREAIFEDIAPYRETTIEERSTIMSALCRLAAEQVAGRPDGWRALQHQDRRRPESEALWLRLVTSPQNPA